MEDPSDALRRSRVSTFERAFSRPPRSTPTIWRSKQRTTVPATAVAAAMMAVTIVETARAVTVAGEIPGGTTAVAPAIAEVLVATGVARVRHTAARGEGTTGIPVAIRAASIRGDVLIASPRAHPPTLRRGKMCRPYETRFKIRPEGLQALLRFCVPTCTAFRLPRRQWNRSSRHCHVVPVLTPQPPANVAATRVMRSSHLAEAAPSPLPPVSRSMGAERVLSGAFRLRAITPANR